MAKSLFEQAQHQIAAAHRGLLRADAYCQNNSTCPFKSSGKGAVIKVSSFAISTWYRKTPTIEQAFQKVLAAAERSPLIAASCVNSTACKSTVTATGIQQGMLNSLMGNPDFPGIFEALDLALQGDSSFFAMAAGDPIPSVPVVWAVPLLCNDYGMLCFCFEQY